MWVARDEKDLDLAERRQCCVDSVEAESDAMYCIRQLADDLRVSCVKVSRLSWATQRHGRSQRHQSAQVPLLLWS